MDEAGCCQPHGGCLNTLLRQRQQMMDAGAVNNLPAITHIISSQHTTCLVCLRAKAELLVELEEPESLPTGDTVRDLMLTLATGLAALTAV